MVYWRWQIKSADDWPVQGTGLRETVRAFLSEKYPRMKGQISNSTSTSQVELIIETAVEENINELKKKITELVKQKLDLAWRIHNWKSWIQTHGIDSPNSELSAKISEGNGMGSSGCRILIT